VIKMDKVLWIVITGSHMWGMNHEGSDLDVRELYQADSKEFLIGKHKKYEGGKPWKSPDGKVDGVRYEIGHFIKQLIKGNCNYIWALMSPLVCKGEEDNYDYVSLYPLELLKLREIFMNNLSKACYHSTRGLAISNYKELNEMDKYSKKWHKKKQLIIRTLQFSINLIKYKKVMFNTSTSYNIGDIDYFLQKLDMVYLQSDLPEKPNEKPFLDYLLKLRLGNL